MQQSLGGRLQVKIKKSVFPTMGVPAGRVSYLATIRQVKDKDLVVKLKGDCCPWLRVDSTNLQTEHEVQARGSLPGRGKRLHRALPGHVSPPWLPSYHRAQAGLVSS